MKRENLQEFIKENSLLTFCPQVSGIYAITIDNGIVYVGQAKDVYSRCAQHIYNIENATFNNEKKYLLLLAAKLGGHRVDCMLIQSCPQDELTEWEDKYIEQINPCLNILTPSGKNDISELKIEDVLNNIKYVFNY